MGGVNLGFFLLRTKGDELSPLSLGKQSEVGRGQRFSWCETSICPSFFSNFEDLPGTFSIFLLGC